MPAHESEHRHKQKQERVRGSSTSDGGPCHSNSDNPGPARGGAGSPLPYPRGAVSPGTQGRAPACAARARAAERGGHVEGGAAAARENSHRRRPVIYAFGISLLGSLGIATCFTDGTILTVAVVSTARVGLGDRAALRRWRRR